MAEQRTYIVVHRSFGSTRVLARVTQDRIARDDLHTYIRHLRKAGACGVVIVVDAATGDPVLRQAVLPSPIGTPAIR